MKNVIPNAEAFIEMLNEGEAFVGMDRHTRNPFIYLGKGEERFYIKKVIVHNEETGSTESKWITAPTKAGKVSKDADPAMVQAYKELLAEGKIQAPTA
jgi:hypothetical protein